MWLPLAFAVSMAIAVACGTAVDAAPVSGSNIVSPQQSESPTPQTDTAPQPEVAATIEPESTNRGLDEACVQRVLGRSVGGFGDVSPAERDAVFEQCSGTEAEQLSRQFASGQGSALLENIDQDCASGITGRNDLDLASMSLEDRQQIISECSAQFDHGFSGGGFADIVDGCVAASLADSPDDVSRLSGEDLAAVIEACSDQFSGGFGRFQHDPPGDGTPPVQGGASHDPGGFFGSGQGDHTGQSGGFGGIDFASDCVTNVVGRTITGPDDLSEADFQRVFGACLQRGH